MKIKKFKNSLKIRKLKIGKLRLRTYIALGLIVLMLPIVFFTLYNPGQSEAGWFDMGYSFRKLVPVANSSGEKQTDFQVQITLDTQSLIADSKMQSDCDDLRVTDINGNLLPLWVEPNTCNTSETLVWTKVPEISTSGADLYVYYGNPSAAAAATGTDNVFIRDMESAVAAWPMQETDANQSYAEAKHPGMDEGRDIVINGGFDDTSSWSTGTNWSISGGLAVASNTSSYLRQALPVRTSQAYELTYTISNYSAGTIRPYIGTGTGSSGGTTRSANGTYTEILNDTSYTPEIYFSTSGFTGSIDNVSVKQVDIPSSANFDGSELLTDGDMEAADTSAWTDYGAATGLSKETINPLQGARLLRILGDNDDTISGASQPDILTIGKTYHVTGYVRSDGTSLPSITTSGSASVFWTGTNSTDWQYFDEIFIADHDGITLRQSSASSVNYTEWDDVSVVEISPLSGSIPIAGDTNRPTVGSDSSGGHLSTAYTFDGTDDYVDIYSSDLNSVFNPDEGTLVAWAKVSDAGVWSDNTYRSIIFLGAEQGNNKVRLYKSSSNDLYTSYEGPDGTEKTVATSTSTTDWFLLIGTWDTSGELKLYLNGIEVGTPSTGLSAIVKNFDSNDVAIGSNYSGSPNNPWSGLINDVRLYDRALSADEIASLYSASADIQAYYTDNYEGHELVRKYDSSVAVGSLAAEEVGPDPVAEWKFDEGQGQEAKDSSSNGNDGQLGSTSDSDTNDPTWRDESMCISGKCLEFDGTDDYVAVSNTLNDVQAVSFWVRPNTSSESIAKLTTNGEISIASGTVTLGSAFTNSTIYVNGLPSSQLPTTNSWNHVVVTFDTLSGDDINLGYDGSNYLQGFLDEVKIYPYARTEAQIREDFNQGAAVLGLSDQGNLSDGLVGYWTMDESSGTTVADKSGNGNNGTLTNAQETGTSDGSGNTTTTVVDTDGTLSTTDDAYNGMILSITDDATCPLTADAERIISDYDGASKTFTISSALSASPDTCSYTILHQVGGKFGNGVEFDGENDYVDVGDKEILKIGTGDFTISTWFNPNTADKDDFLVGQGNPYNAGGSGYDLSYQGNQSGDDIFVRINDGSSSPQTIVAQDVGDLSGAWHHILITIDHDGLVKIFLDGIERGSAALKRTGDIQSNAKNFVIGGINNGLSGNADVKLDETRIYNRALSPSEVKQLYEWAPGPVGYWDFEEGSGDTAFDKSGNGNNGSLGADPSTPSWTSGKYGKALDFDGSNDYASVNDNSILKPKLLTISTWIKPSQALNTITPAFSIVIDKYTLGGGGYRILYTKSSDSLTASIYHNGNVYDATVSSASSLLGTSWHYVSLTFDGNTVSLYVDGDLKDTTTAQVSMVTHGTETLYFGAYDGTLYFFPGLIDDVRIYNYARTPEQIRQDMEGLGQSTAAGADPLPQPVAHWSFDEMQGQTANDKVGGNNGTLGADGNAGTDDPTWTSSGKVNGALSFDGGDFIDLTGFTSSSQTYTFSFWMKSSVAASQYDYFFDSQSGRLVLAHQIGVVNDRIGIANPTWIDLGAAPRDGIWHHVTYVLDDTTSTVSLYIDGKTYGTGSYSGVNLGGVTRIGNFYADTTSGFQGTLDEFKIYNSALSAEQVILDFNSGKSLNFGGSDEAADMTDGAGNPPIAYWDFEEKSGSTLHDKSGNGNDGDITGAIWKSGCKYGACLEFDGGDGVDYINLGSSQIVGGTNISEDFTVETWINAGSESSGSVVFSQNNSTQSNTLFELLPNNNQLAFNARNDSGILYQVFASSPPLLDSKWHHLSVTRDGTSLLFYLDGQQLTSNTSFSPSGTFTFDEVYIGARTSNSLGFTGLIDHVKVYDYARTPAQIAYDYNRGAPIAHWKFNECEGSTIHDSSGNGNHGTLAVTTDGGNSAGVGTCNTGSSAWGSGATGKFGSSLNFDGDGDYTNVASDPISGNYDNYATSVWIKKDTSSSVEIIIQRVNTSNNNSVAGQVSVDSNGKIVVDDYTPTGGQLISNKIVDDNSWHHIVLTRSGTNRYLYIDGILDTSESSAETYGGSTTNNIYIGVDKRYTNDQYHFSGQIDDVQIYNYALSPAQVRKLYNGGAAVKFGE